MIPHFAAPEEDLMFCEFHDILPGSCIQSAEEDAIVHLSHGIAEAEKIQLKAFFALSGGQPKAESGEYPILVYNPHPFAVRRDVECEFMLADQNWSEEEFYDVSVHCNGEKIPVSWKREQQSALGLAQKSCFFHRNAAFFHEPCARVYAA